MAAWRWALADCATRAFGGRELAHARGRNVTWRLDGAASAGFTLGGRSGDRVAELGQDEAAVIIALATDLKVWRDSVLVFRGRIGPETDEIGLEEHTSTFTAVDYRSMLQSRMTGTAGASYSSVAGGAIALDLITVSQALSGGNWGVAAGVGTASGTTRIKTILAGKPVSESIDELARLEDGFEWEISPDLLLNIWHPTRGSSNGVVLDLGGNLAQASRLLSPSNFANSVLATGTTGLTPAVGVSGTIAADARGRWEQSAGFVTIENQSTLDDKAPWLLAQTSVLRPAWSVTFRRGRWGGPTHVWLGDTVSLKIKSGRFTVEESHRVAEISVGVGEDGDETVRLGLLEVS